MNLEELKEIINQYKDKVMIHKNESYSGHIQSNIQLFKKINNKYPNLFYNIIEVIYLIKNINNLENCHIFCYCGKKNTFAGLKVGYSRFCSNKCASNSFEFKEKYENTLLQRYGVKQLAKTDFMQKKFKDSEWGKRCRYNQMKTFQKRTGYRHPLVCPESKQKFENIMYICDKNYINYPKGYKGFNVYGIEKLLEDYLANRIDKIIICSIYSSNEIFNNLLEKGVELVGAFDINKDVIGKDASIVCEGMKKKIGVKIEHADNFEKFLQENVN